MGTLQPFKQLLIRGLLVISPLLCGHGNHLNEFKHNHKRWDHTLKNYVFKDGSVRYKRLKNDIARTRNHPFTVYTSHELTQVTEEDFATWNSKQQMSYLINAYNALTIKLIIEGNPKSSIKELGTPFKSPWKKNFFSLLGGKITNLDQIEHKHLRVHYNEPRIHSLINCASKSCPKLINTAVTPQNIERLLRTSMKRFLHDEKKNHYNKKTNTLHLSKIFKWFKKDFTKEHQTLKFFVKKHGPEDLARQINKKTTIKFKKYDWSLNRKNR